MSTDEKVRGRAVVVQPGEAPSFWQPVPANGHADPTLDPVRTGFDALALGYQTIAPGGRVREHSHSDQVELQICFRGSGRVVVDGQTHPLHPGTACFLGYDVKHEIINEGDDELVMPIACSMAPTSSGRANGVGAGSPGRRGRPMDSKKLSSPGGVMTQSMTSSSSPSLMISCLTS